MNEQELTGLLALLRGASAAAAYEAIGKRGDVDSAVKALVPGTLCVGVAHTIRAHAQYAAGVNMLLDGAPAGSVIVIDAGHDGGNCVFGGSGALAAQMRGVAGVVTNARVRDLAEMQRLRFPVFGLGTTVRSGRNRDLPARSGVPVVIGNQIVQPGDIIVADDDGVVVIAQEHFPGLVQRLSVRLEYERQVDEKVRAGVAYGQAIAKKA